MTGLKDADLEQQLSNFSLQITQYFPKQSFDKPTSWLAAFNLLTKVLRKSRSKKKPVIFFDELPWIAGKKSGFTEALGHWWNNWASQQSIVLVICGSAASWMIKHIVNAKGGLHNRITKLITLTPFTLSETKAFLESKKMKLSDYQIIQIYMAVGGIPHYLEQIKKGKSAAQNIQSMCFAKNGVLRSEFDNLYSALFDNATGHVKIIKALFSKAKGLDRKQILKATKMSDGGYFSDMLKELETSGFISTFEPLEKKKKDTLYRLTDEYSLFYLYFMANLSKKGSFNWNRAAQSQQYKIWCGYAFETLCIKHIDKIKEALGISGIQTNANSFLHRKNKAYNKGFQIDLLIDRKDDVINICEMKFYADEYKISADYAKNLRSKKEGLKQVSKTKKMVHLTFISTYGIVDNSHKLDLVDNDLKANILF